MEVESGRCLFSSFLGVAADAAAEMSLFVLFGCFEGWLRLIADGSQPLPPLKSPSFVEWWPGASSLVSV